MLDQPPTHDISVSHHPPFTPTTRGQADTTVQRDVRTPKTRISLSQVATLSRLLTANEPLPEVLFAAVRIGMEWLPDSTRLLLFAIEETGTDAVRPLVVANRAQQGAPPERGRLDVLPRTANLSHVIGAQALAAEHIVRGEGCICLRLMYRADLVGVLVIETENIAREAAPDEALAILAEHLAVLLARRRHDCHAQRADAAIREVTPRGRMPFEPAPEATINDEQKLLKQLATHLRGLFGARVAVAVCSPAEHHLRLLWGRHSPRELSVAESRALLAALNGEHGAEPSILAAGSPPLSGLASVLGHDAVDRVVVLPVVAQGLRVGLVLLPLERAQMAVADTNLSVARSLCLVTGERIRALRAMAAQEALGQQYDAFLSLMAHELRSPLTSVKGYAQLLIRQARRHALPEPVMRSTEAIEQQSGRISEMIDELHDAARIRRDRLEVLTGPVELVSIVRQQVERWEKLAPEHHYQLTVGDEPLMGEWDGHRVMQIVRDLLDNATRYSPSGGTISVEVSRKEEMAELSVRDPGIGIGPEEREKIFTYLYRAPSAQSRNLSGLGLGLFVSRTVARRLGGDLWLRKSTVGDQSGSEFCLALPLSGAEQSEHDEYGQV